MTLTPAVPARRDDELIAALEDPSLRELASVGVVRRYAKGVILINEGDRGDAMFIVLAGRVKIYASNAAGKEVVLNFHGPGRLLGEMALDEGPRSASVVTVEPTVCAVLGREQLKARLAADPEFALRVIVQLIRQARKATENIKSLALSDVYGRLVQFLERNAEPHGGAWVIPEKLSQQAIAERLGCSRDMISKLFKDLVAGGYVRVEDRSITVLRKLPPAW